MPKTKTHFEQVPLEIVKKVATEMTQPEETGTQSRKKKLHESLWPLDENGKNLMIEPFDIFKLQPDGRLSRLAAAMTIESATACIRELAAGSSGEYLIFDQRTQDRFVITIENAQHESVGPIGGPRGQRMSDEQLEFPAWQAPLQDVILERDPERLREKIQTVVALIAERLQQLGCGIDGHREKTALMDGTNARS